MFVCAVFVFLFLPSSLMADVEDMLLMDMRAVKKFMQSMREDMDALTHKVDFMQSMKKEMDALTHKVEYLEIIGRKNVPRTCQELRDLGVTKSGEYMIDPDGVNVGDPPIKVICEMNDGGSGITTNVLHDFMESTNVKHCEKPGCSAEYPVTYVAKAKQMKALKEISANCSQTIRYSCKSSPLKRLQKNMAWWAGADNVTRFYWHGHHHATDHRCACADSKTCIAEGLTCNCDAGYPSWTSDEGVLKDQAALPVKQLNFVGLAFPSQMASFELGPLACSGKKKRKEFRATASCETLRMTGHTLSGYYFVDGPEGIHHDLVFCNMELESAGDANFQVNTKVKLPEYPVAFDVSFPINYRASKAAVLTWEKTYSNVGNAIDAATGKFTAPFDGVYKFTLFVYQEKHISRVKLHIRKNVLWVAAIWDEPGSGNGHGTSSVSTILILEKGDIVDAYMDDDGYIASVWTSHFMGYLLFPV